MKKILNNFYNKNNREKIFEFLVCYSYFKKFKIDNIKYITENNINFIEAKIYYENKRIFNNFMDIFLNEYTNYLTVNLYNILHKNVYYNIINGKIKIII